MSWSPGINQALEVNVDSLFVSFLRREGQRSFLNFLDFHYFRSCTYLPTIFLSPPRDGTHVSEICWLSHEKEIMCFKSIEANAIA